jgi:hypothetical protein
MDPDKMARLLASDVFNAVNGIDLPISGVV